MTDPRRTLRALALVTVTTFALAACQSTPSTPPLLDLPPASATAAPDLERWWTTFNDPTLTALMEEALAHNLDLRAAMVRVDLARANVLLAQSYLYPSMNLGIDTRRNRMTLVGSQPLPENFNPTNNDYLVGLRAAHEVDLWGRYRNGASAARSELLATVSRSSLMPSASIARWGACARRTGSPTRSPSGSIASPSRSS